MIDTYQLVDQLTSSTASQGANARYLSDFAFELGWKPSYHFELPGTEEFIAGNLVVEHGLENSAVISFLRRPSRFEDLDFSQRKALISASYNNLIDWHLAIDVDNISFVHNRVDPPRFFVDRRRLGRDRINELSVTTFEAISSKHLTPNAPALDTALVKTISFWKRSLQLELPDLKNENISTLFNGIILGRALEDHFRQGLAAQPSSLRRAASVGEFGTIQNLLSGTFDSYNVNIPDSLWSPELITAFDALEIGTVRELINDFYRDRFEHYFDYDFAIMSKHALSRIYERYVSLLRTPDPPPQTTLFGELPVEVKEKSFGNVYTPEFIARFFAKYVRREMPLQRFQKIVVGDPACGSGIFLRTMVEMKGEALFQDFSTRSLTGLFQSVEGVDIDANACASTRLSLSLLSLVLTNSIPSDLKIAQTSALNLPTGTMAELDVVIANPPFVKSEDLTAETRESLFSVLGPNYKGKPDLYLGVLKVSLSLL